MSIRPSRLLFASILSLFTVALAPAAVPAAKERIVHRTAAAPAPPVGPADFRCNDYLRLGKYVQSLPDMKRFQVLRAGLKLRSGGQANLVVLCRMLFAEVPGRPFRAAASGAPTLLGGTSSTQWPSEPIELVNGVPFFVVRSYYLAGVPESPLSYLEFCRMTGAWNPTKYAPKSGAELGAALQKLLHSPKWKRSLNADEVKFLTNQTHDAPGGK